ncbi:hypothetical protein E2C01_095609 [Portunus trituberculatus]|uniref:Uncharacterized protein n=1 Tax=Portunus trituberculatus TaxID=210409 RepID=A0A5B7K0L2_PORTR|nr:hypothetical protein [Portunus trituberculatus]
MPLCLPAISIFLLLHMALVFLRLLSTSLNAAVPPQSPPPPPPLQGIAIRIKEDGKGKKSYVT